MYAGIMAAVAKTIVICLNKTQLSLTAGSDTRGAGYRQGLEGLMMPILSHRSQVVQPSLHSRSKILVEMAVQLMGISGPREWSVHMRGGLEEILFVLHAQGQSLTTELRSSLCRLGQSRSHWTLATPIPCFPGPKVFTYCEFLTIPVFQSMGLSFSEVK